MAIGDTDKETEVQWVKHSGSASVDVLGKDVAVLASGNHITFVETSRPEKKELIYCADCEVRGDGVQCLCTHKTLPCFAFAEMCRNPRILIVSYPSFDIVKNFESVTDSNYVALRFSEMEFLVALTGIPDYKIAIWNWRTSEKLYTQETKLESPEQILRVSHTSPIQILQTTTQDRKVFLWDMNLCYKKTLLNKSVVSLPEESQPPYSFAYGADGELYFSDSEGNVYSLNPETHVSSLQIPSKTNKVGAFVPCLTWHRGGLAFMIPKEIHFWKRRSPEGWTKIWSFSPKMPFRCLLSPLVKELLLGVTSFNEIVQIKGEPQAEFLSIKTFGSDFEFVCFVYPVGDYLVTFGNAKKIFTTWDKVTGQKISQMSWFKDRINVLEPNHKYPYLVAATAAGSVHIISVYDPHFIFELDQVFLTSNSLDAVRFRGQGLQFSVANMDVGEFFLFRLPSRIEVIAHIKIDLKVVDFSIIRKENMGTYLLIVPVSQFCCRAGQTILLYVLDEKEKTFDYVKDIAMPSVTTRITSWPHNPREMLCVPHRSRRLYAMNLYGKVLIDFVSGHQMKSITGKCENDYFVTFGMDGIVIVMTNDTKRCGTVFLSHHRLAKGVKSVAIDSYMQYVVTLGENGSLVCTFIKNLAKTERRADNEAALASPQHKQIFTSPFTSEKVKIKNVERNIHFQGATESNKESKDPIEVTPSEEPKKVWWLSLREHEKILAEEQQSKKEKHIIQEELANIKKKLRQLLDENYSNVPERQLPGQAFDLDKAGRRKKLEDGKTEREKERQMQLASMKYLNKITDVIRKVCWDSIEVKGREVRGILTSVAVQSYALMPDPEMAEEELAYLMEAKRIEEFFHKGDYFEPWVPRTDSSLELHLKEKFEVSTLDVTHAIKTKYEDEQLEDESARADSEELKKRFVWTGTSTHNYVDVDDNHHSQFELTSFLQSHQEIQLIEIDIKKLMLWFNKEFAETFALKEREMAFVRERNDRFRRIISELEFFHFSPNICKTQIFDPEWAPEENPDTILAVEDSEITVPMYVSDSKLDVLKKGDLEEESSSQLPFKERALIAMMDGVLEKFWEDEIKKDVPKPKCLTSKEPEYWTEDDQKAVRAYEEAVKTLNSERERYRKILEAEWAKSILQVKDSISKFDEKVAKLHLLKLKVESAIGQETLKCLRIRQRCFQRLEMDRKEEDIKANIIKNEKNVESLTVELNKIVEMLGDCRNYYETLQNKDRNLDKNFKREFPEYSPIVCEQLYKLSKKRPKLLQRAAIYSTILNDMGKCAVSGTKSEYMPSECIQYLKDIDALDAHSNAPAAVSLQSWEVVCKMRRIKIDCELKIRACAIDLADAEATVFNHQKALKAAKEYQTQLQNDLQAIRTEKLNASLNYPIQLVLKKGLVQIPQTGQESDFNECVLVTHDTVGEVNQAIQKMGSQKIKAMQKDANFRKRIIYQEWEHKKLRMENEDLKSQLETIERLQVLKELQAIIIARVRGFSDKKGISHLKKEIAGVKEKYQKLELEIRQKIDEMDAKIQNISSQNLELDEKITELNVEVNEMNLERDNDFDKKNMAEHEKRMKKVRERSQLMRKIQEQHSEILVLQTELELQRLRTYPAIKYKVL